MNGKEYLRNKYSYIIENLKKEGCYIYGSAMLGDFVSDQCKKNAIEVKGIVDTYKTGNGILKPSMLKKDDIVILASIYYPEMIDTLKKCGVKNYIYYEELAQADSRFDVYYTAFLNIFEEYEQNVDKYFELRNVFEDDLSKAVYDNILQFRQTLDLSYAEEAMQLSVKHGNIDFDEIIIQNLDMNYSFFDCGGFDGQSSMDFIRSRNEKYRCIYYFEPDEQNMEKSRKRLASYSNIEFLLAGVGESVANLHYDAWGGAVVEKYLNQGGK